MEQLRCVVERITYQNPENGYSIIRETFSWDKRMAQMNEVYKHLCSKE